VECDFENEETKTELEARLKACTSILDDSKFLMVSEAHEGIIIILCAFIHVWLNH
jgi:hypothetical protein